MAVTFNNEHHKSPSGYRNKVVFLLIQCKCNINEIHRFVSEIPMKEFKQIESWCRAEHMAIRLVHTLGLNENSYVGKFDDLIDKYVNSFQLKPLKM